MTDRELMQQALEALDRVISHAQEAEDILLAALSEGTEQPQRTHWEGCEAVHPECKQLEQEPVAHTLNCVCGAVWDISLNGAEEMVHTPDAPKPRREWVGLTDEEVKALPQWFPSHETAAVLPLIRAIEAKLKEKNA